MKKSEIYQLAMEVVVDCMQLSPKKKIEIVNVLLDNKNVAEYVERQEEEADAKAQENNA